MDGSGFYSCDMSGQHLTLYHPSGTSFTVCGLEVYEDVNLIELEKLSARGGTATNAVSVTSNASASKGSFDNLLAEHPL